MEKSLFFWLFIVFITFFVVLIILKFILSDSNWMKHEVLRLETILKDLISMSDKDQLAKQIVDEFDLLLFHFRAADLLDKKQMEEYYHSLVNQVNSIFKCRHYSNEGTVVDLLSIEKSCRECHGDCTFCSYLISRDVAYYNDYINGTEGMYERF